MKKLELNELSSLAATPRNIKERKRPQSLGSKRTTPLFPRSSKPFLAPNKFISLRAFDMHLLLGKRYVLTTNPKIPPSQIPKEMIFNLIVVRQIWTSGNGLLKSGIAIMLCLT
jgi:hypothetical protein